MVVTGLFIGNHGRRLAMSDRTRENLDTFWELIDEILNMLLFMLIGLEVILISFSVNLLIAIQIVIVLTLLARLFTVGMPTGLFGEQFRLPRGSWKVLTWGGLRGGISVALALSLPHGPAREVVLALTYSVVIFSILGQGLTIGSLARKVVPAHRAG